MTRIKRYDLAVVGSGSGTVVLEAALEKGLSCAIVEKSKFGGTCLTRGCIPSKMLVYPADLIREVEAAPRVGLKTRRPMIDWDVISGRMWGQIDLHKTILQEYLHTPNLDVYQGVGSFIGPDAMMVRKAGGVNTAAGAFEADDLSTPTAGRGAGAGVEFSADRFVVAAGARSYVPDIDGLEAAGYLTYETFFGEGFPKKPWDSLAIIGGGSISLEFAHIFSAFGTKVTIIQRSGRVLRNEDEEIAVFVQNRLADAGVDIFTDSAITGVEAKNGKKYITFENRSDQTRSVAECDEILVAMGVSSNADGLAAEAAGVALDGRGWIITNEYLETSQPHIWAIGDINGKHQLRHKANYEAEVLTRNLFGGAGKKEAVDYGAVPRATYTHPQTAGVGLTEDRARELGIAYRCVKNRYSEIVAGRAMGFSEGDADDGFVKVLVGGDDRIIGAHIAGPQAAALLHPYVYLMRRGGRYTEIYDSMTIHPSLGELTAWAFEKLEGI